MDGTLLNTKVYGGFAKAAQRVGLPYDQYRALFPTDPLDIENKIATLPAAFTVHGSASFDFTKVSDYDKPLFHVLIDATKIQRGDYLVGEFGTFFIIEMTPAMPPLAVACNRTVTIWSQGPQGVAPGLTGYGGTIAVTDATAGNETPICSNLPASLLIKSRSMRDAYLPSDTGAGMFRCLIPAFPGVYIRVGSIIVDDLNQRYAVQVAELQDLGWRLDAQQQVT